MPGCGGRAWSRCALCQLSPRVLRVLTALLACYMCGFLVQLELVWLIPRGPSHASPRHPSNRNRSPCPNLLARMSQGSWVQDNVTWLRTQELKNLITEVRSQYNFPASMQRDDRKCGNVSFASNVRSDKIMRFFRATCSPDGQTPCCRLGRCVSEPQLGCVCPTCIDLRRELYAEAASWITEDSLCAPRRFSTESACMTLVGTTLVLAGDSLMKQLYVNFLLLLTGNFRNGALGTNVSEDTREKCSGLHQYTDKECRHFISSSRSVCHGAVTVVFIPCPRAVHVQYLLDSLASLPFSRTLLVTSIGLHDSFNAQLVRRGFLLPLMRYLKQFKMMGPEMLWLTTHAFGTLSFAPERSDTIVQQFNSEITRFLEAAGHPVLDMHLLTRGVVSPDGVHFGHGVNDVKARMILTYLHHRRLERGW